MIFKKNLILLSAILSAAKADCFDGNNFGCSHFCSGSVCSCPPCWVLGEDGKTCRFEAGKAQVVCSANGAEVTINKCAVPDVDPATIHLKNTACSATEENENTWKLVTGFSDCGSEFSFSEEKLTLQNTLMIGPSIVAGRQQSRKYKIAFSCSYNDDVQASSTIRANDVIFEGVRFDINDAQPIDFSFGFALDFYKSKEFTTLASDGSFQPGSPLFVKVSPTSALSEALEFSVNKCTVKDEVISQSADILNTCPVTGTNFEFLPGQKDRSAVKFTYKSFIFAASETTAEINLSCDIKLCPQNSVECLKLCGTTPVTPLPKDHIAIFTRPALASYLINKEGTTSSGPQITGPSDRFIRSKSAIIANIPYMFGGIVKPRRIAYLDSCAFVELNVELNNDYYDSHAALAYNAGSNALICFGNADNAYNYCSDFDGTTVRTRPSTTYSHRYGGLGFYGGTPITVGSYYPDGNKKCEVFHGSGWTTLDNDHPSDVYGHSLVGLENGHVLLIGGVDNNGWHNTIWRMRGGQTGWESYGSIQEAVRGASTIILDKSIFVIGGSNRDYYPYQRVDLTEDGSFEKSALLGYNHLNGWEPLLLIVDANFCSAS